MLIASNAYEVVISAAMATICRTPLQVMRCKDSDFSSHSQ